MRYSNDEDEAGRGGEGACTPPDRASGRETRTATFRKDIQGLRAVAVVAVVVFHVRAWVLPGGFVGVDVFFVISGYLITGLLLREIETTGSVSIGAFYARRVRRLLPIATVVLLVVALCIGFLPASRWRATASEIVASALYVQNWLLADRSIDYFASNKGVDVLRHYWSLSVEEQYCLLWPLLLIGGGRLGAFRRDPRRSLGWVLIVVAVASFTWSVQLTEASPRLAFFSTPARLWEFALGGLLAAFAGGKGWSRSVRQAVGVVGLALIGTAAVFFDDSTRFPGHAALLPTAGATLVLASGGDAARWSPLRLLESAPAQYLGDVSYSLYLWHWPVFAFFRLAGSTGGISEVVLVLLVSTALAHQSKVLIEDPFRAPGGALGNAVRPVLLGACSILLAVLAASSIRVAAAARSSPAGYRDLIGSQNYPGAKVLTRDAAPPAADVRFLPSAVDGFEDAPEARPPGCFGSMKQPDLERCEYGDPTSATHLVLIGDSHAMQWIPALAEVAEMRGWRLTAVTKASCGFAGLPFRTNEGLLNQPCIEWNARVLEELERLDPDVVVIAQSAGLRLYGSASGSEGPEKLSKAYAESWRKLIQDGFRVAVLRETPWMGFDVPDCLTSRSPRTRSCSWPRQRALGRDDPLIEAARRAPGVRLVDMSDAICGAETCEAVVGNVLVWRDSHHLTASYSRTVAPALVRALAPLVAGVGSTERRAIPPRATRGG